MEIMVKLMFTILTANVMERNRKMSDLARFIEEHRDETSPVLYVNEPGWTDSCKYMSKSTLDISALEKWIEEYKVKFNKFLIDNAEVLIR
jgi:hypothetical protein